MTPMSTRDRKNAEISAADYELALLEVIRLEFAPTPIRVFGTDKYVKHSVVGHHSRVRRQLDVAAYRPGEERPFLIADAKRRGRKIHVVDAEAFLGLVEDVGADLGLLVSPMGFTAAAARRVAQAQGRVQILTIEDALTFRWLPVARRVYPRDWYFHAELARAIRLLNEAAPLDDVIAALEPLAFEEWVAFIRDALEHDPNVAVPLLETIAAYHLDAGWRLNAIELLDGRLSTDLAQQLLRRERDPETAELLREYLTRVR